MIRSAVYCRVSTDNQEKEGTSLQTQLENCLKYCESKDYEPAYRFSEAFSGLKLERPELDKLRELVRNGSIDVIVCHSIDRLSRDPTHGVIITQELEKHSVKLETVTETVESNEIGKLITYIRGFASKLEAEKIKERTTRGKRAAKEAGRIFCGAGKGVYGYDYLRRVKGERQASRVINETQAQWVRQIFDWLVTEGLTTNAIVYRLRALGAPTKAGGVWGKSSVQKILRNPAYAGNTNATPAIISQDIYETAQKQLSVNKAKASRNCKHEYLLRGHIRCRHCGHAYAGEPHRGKYYYRCLGRRKVDNPNDLCRNKVWSADTLESSVWNELTAYLGDRDLIKTRLNSQKENADRLKIYEGELERIERQFKALDREQHQLLQWALKGFPESQVESENKRLNEAKDTLSKQKTDTEAQLKASQEASVNIPNLERFIQDLQDKLPGLDFEGKRLALDWLGITVWIDGDNVDITGIIEPEKAVCIATTTLYRSSHNPTLPFSLKISPVCATMGVRI